MKRFLAFGFLALVASSADAATYRQVFNEVRGDALPKVQRSFALARQIPGGYANRMRTINALNKRAWSSLFKMGQIVGPKRNDPQFDQQLTPADAAKLMRYARDLETAARLLRQHADALEDAADDRDDNYTEDKADDLEDNAEDMEDAADDLRDLID